MTMDNEQAYLNTDSIGQQLEAARTEKGYSVEYVAGKLHLRAQVLNHIEADEYDKLPQPVFIKGYIRAYAKCVELDAEPLIDKYDQDFAVHKPVQETFLWQRSKHTNHGVALVKWFTVLSLSAVIISVGFWWKKARDAQNTSSEIGASLTQKQIDKQKQLTDLNKMSTVIKLPSQESTSG